MDEKKGDKEGKSGVKVVDRRLGKEGGEGPSREEPVDSEGRAPCSADGGKGGGGPSEGGEEPSPIIRGPGEEGKIPLPEPNFINFILSLWTTANLHMGYFKKGEGEGLDVKEDLKLAKHTIDTIDMLKRMTERNRTKEEDELVSSILYDLRMKFVEKSRNVN